MRKVNYMLAAAVCALSHPAFAATAPTDKTGADEPAGQSQTPQREVFSTGVAKGRDILDAAISTSVIKEEEVQYLSARTMGEILRSIPGVRVDPSIGEGDADFTIRGLPIASTGAKFFQLEEDGLPLLEFGDITTAGPDVFLRADLNIAQIEAIRGGSSATFNSNSPGGVINLMSKTGEVEGGSVLASAGIDFDQARLDFDYGGRLSDSIRYHVGGFYRQGEGVRRAGYDAYKGGQFKFNVTKEFAGGYIRLYGKYLDDRTPTYIATPMVVGGTDSDPAYASIQNFSAKRDFLGSRYYSSFIGLDENNNISTGDMRDGKHSISKAVGLEAKFDVSEWTVSDRFRYSNNSLDSFVPYPGVVNAAANLFPGATLSYASGPNAGQVIVNPATANGNGLFAILPVTRYKLGVDYVVNDLRASRVWKVGGGDVTTTIGFYKSRQNVSYDDSSFTALTDLVGGGKFSPVDIAFFGFPITDNGVLGYESFFPRRVFDVDYDINAPYGALNYHTGKLSVGASLRYDFGKAQGIARGGGLGNAANVVARDMNGNGLISAPEQRVSIVPLTPTAPINYDWSYLSYSFSANYRIAEELSVFARYSRGARANADRLLYTAAINPADGSLAQPDAVIDYVKQAEAGVKYRTDNVTVNATAFWASTLEHNAFFGPVINRQYRTYGLELEASYRNGPFRLDFGATYTHGEISKDAADLTVVGNTPHGQPALFVQATPMVEFGPVRTGASIYGISGRYSADTNQLKMPGYVTVNPFLLVKVAERTELSLNVNNVFNALGVNTVVQPSIPANGVVYGQTVPGRTVSGSLRFNF